MFCHAQDPQDTTINPELAEPAESEPKNAKAAEAAKNVLSRAAPRNTTINTELTDSPNRNPKNTHSTQARKSVYHRGDSRPAISP